MDLGFTEETVKEISGAAKAVGGAVLAVTVFFKWMLPRVACFVVRKSYIRYLRDAHRLHFDMSNIRRAAGLERVVFFTGHNGGKLPEISKPFYVSAHDWSIDDAHRDLFPSFGYQNVPADAGYVTLLLEMATNGVVRAFPDNMDPSSVIYRIYHAEGVRDSYWFYVGAIDSQMAFISIASVKGLISSDSLIKAEVIINRIRKNMCC